MERDVSEFNGSQLKLLRIDEIIKGIIQCRHTLDLHNWLNYLQDFDMELESVKKKDEIIETDKELKKLAHAINSHIALQRDPRIRHKQTPAEIVEKLDAFQKKLLRIYKESGLELKLQEGALGGFGR